MAPRPRRSGPAGWLLVSLAWAMVSPEPVIDPVQPHQAMAKQTAKDSASTRVVAGRFVTGESLRSYENQG